MPKIQWTGLPQAIREHLLLRLKERSITEQDLYRLRLWRESEPDAPDGEWWKDFGTFKLCGEGAQQGASFLKPRTTPPS